MVPDNFDQYALLYDYMGGGEGTGSEFGLCYGPTGLPRSVFSVSDGTVGYVGWEDPANHRKGWGYYIRVDDPEGFTVTAHVYDPAVNVGDTVRRGQYIAEMANPTNGNSTGPHVHVERRLWPGRPTDRVNPGIISPILGGRVTSRYGVIDAAHPKPHGGTDYAF